MNRAERWVYLADNRSEHPNPQASDGFGQPFPMDMPPQDDKRHRVVKAALECRLELLTYARSLLGNYAAAEDAVQEAMLVVFEKFDTFQEGTSILAWCRSIVRIEVLRAKTRHHRDKSLAERLLDEAIDSAFAEHQLEKEKETTELWREILRGCVARLPKRGQNVLRARFADELSYQQIGENLHMTTEAVRKALFRLKKQLRSCVETNLKGMR